MDAAHLKSVNFYLVEINNRFVLIDTGIASEACWDKLVMTLKQHNLTFSNIEAIMLTHHHSDHSGLVNRIRQISNIPVYAHPESINRLKRLPHFLRKRVQFFEQYYKKMGAQDELDNYIHYLNNAINKHTNQTITGEILPIKEGDDLYGLSVIDIPGHSPDHL